MSNANLPNPAGGPPPKPPTTRTRSPGYPAINLEAALKRANTVWENEQRSAAPMEALAEHWEINAKSSTFLLSVAALKKFGLLEEVEGTQRKLKLSELALNILLHEKDAPERAALLKTAALKPKIHAELWAEYNGVMPSDATLRHYLIMQKAFNADSVSGFISQFKETISFANVTANDKVVIEALEEQEEDSNMNSTVPPPRRIAAPLPRSTPPPPRPAVNVPETPIFTTSGTVAREFTFPVPNGTVILKLPFPMSEADYATLVQTLEIFKPGIVRTETPIVTANHGDWQLQAEALAEAKVAFNLAGFSFTHHVQFYNELKKKYALQASFDPVKQIAYFKPKT